jgi:hypothetical protein
MPPQEKLAGLVGIHLKLGHSPATDMHHMLYRAGHGKDVLAFIPKVLESRRGYNSVNVSIFKNTRLAEYFIWRVQTNMFFQWETVCAVLSDECIRYACERNPTRVVEGSLSRLDRILRNTVDPGFRPRRSLYGRYGWSRL